MAGIYETYHTVKKAYELLEWLQRRGVEVGRSTATDPITNVERVLFQGILYNAIYHPAFSWFEFAKLRKDNLGRIDVGDLKKATIAKPWLAGPVECKGIFLAGSLLNMGWWDRKGPRPESSWFSLFRMAGQNRLKDDAGLEDEIAAADLPWRGLKDVQSWLYSGFHLWAPSWDVNRWDGGSSDPYLFGQIGRLDEADSLPVIVADPDKARVCREILTSISKSRGCLIAEATVRGRLHSVHELERYKGDKQLKHFIKKLVGQGAIRDNCLVIDKDISDRSDLNDRIDLHEKSINEPYSGYIWKCVCPSESKDDPEALLSSYFVWEHTNLASKDAINYNLDAINHKISYIASQHRQSKKDFALLQEMMPEDRLRGEPGSAYDKPVIAVDEFAGLFAELSRKPAKLTDDSWPTRMLTGPEKAA
jgi:hypothetical protein